MYAQNYFFSKKMSKIDFYKQEWELKFYIFCILLYKLFFFIFC